MSVSLVLLLVEAAAIGCLTACLVLTRRRLRHVEAENGILRAQPDPVTGLALRAQWVVEARDKLLALPNPAVLFLDVNKLKQINDVHSHHDGDRLLRAIATRFQQALGPDACVGRIGGDEMVAVVNLPDRWHTYVENVASACVVELFGVVCGAALGLARPVDVARKDTGERNPHPQVIKAVSGQLDRVMHAADLALQQAKDYCRAHDVPAAVRFYGPQHAPVPAELESHPLDRARDGVNSVAPVHESL